jgi:hypothetical protein
MYEQGYADFWNYSDPQEDNPEYNIGWADALAEVDQDEYREGQNDFKDGLEMEDFRSQAYQDGYNSDQVQRSTLA